MSRIKELLNDKRFIINLSEIMMKICPVKKAKYLDLLIRIITKKLSDEPNSAERYRDIRREIERKYEIKDVESLSDIEIIIILSFFSEIFSDNNFILFKDFCVLNEKNLIHNNDLSKYNTFDQIGRESSMAQLKTINKKMESQVITIFRDDDWIILRPLTHESSRKYGAGTRWCTTSEGNEYTFNEHVFNGCLIYTINLKNGKKIAAFKSFQSYQYNGSTTFWNEIDDRIDSIDTGLPEHILEIIKIELLSGKTNYDLAPDDIKGLLNDFKLKNTITETPQPVVREYTPQPVDREYTMAADPS